MVTQPNQVEFLRKISMYLDNELNQDSERELLREIKQNPQYMDVLNKEQAFRDFVRSRVQRRSVSPDLIQSIKEKIRISPA